MGAPQDDLRGPSPDGAGSAGDPLPGPSAVARVLLADDHDFVRTSVRRLLDDSPHLRVVAECADGDEVLPAALRTRPHVALLDLAMPRRSGLEAARDLLSHLPGIRVVLLTGRLDPRAVREARELGLHGYLLKGDEPDRLADNVRRVAGGATAWAAEVSLI